MPISLGNLVVEGAYLGSEPATRVMLGTTEVWSAGRYPVSNTKTGVLTETSAGALPPVLDSHTVTKKGLFRITASLRANNYFLYFRVRGAWGDTFGQTLENERFVSTAWVLSLGEVIELRGSVLTGAPPYELVWTIEELDTYVLANSSPDHWFPLKFTDSPYQNRGIKTTELAFHTETKFGDRGQHAYIERGSKSRLDLQETWEGSWSMSGWFQRTGTATVDGDVLFARGNPTVGREVRLYADPNGADLRLHINSGSSTSTTALIPGALTTGEWKHIAITSELTGGRPHILVYLDGVAVYETYVANNFPFSLTDWVSFGNYADNTLSSPFNGNLDDPALWSRTLSSNEVFQIFQNGRIPT